MLTVQSYFVILYLGIANLLNLPKEIGILKSFFILFSHIFLLLLCILRLRCKIKACMMYLIASYIITVTG